MNRSHWPSLDGLRGVAILLVIAHNVQLLDTDNMHGLIKATQWVLNIGWVGVTLFFCLSGFLITHILLTTVAESNALWKFIARRTLRIFPLYYLTLLVLLLLLPALGLQPAIYQYDSENAIGFWFYVSNWTVPAHPKETALCHFWSLAVEEQFYLFWPLLVLGLRTPQKVLTLSLTLTAVSIISRVYFWTKPNGQDINYFWTICRLDSLSLGAAAAACWHWTSAKHWIQSNAHRILIVSGFLFVATGLITRGYARTSFLGQTIGYTTLSIAFAVLVYALATKDEYHRSLKPSPTDWVKQPLLTSIGKYSYAMYVFHKPLHDVFSAKILRALGVNPAGNLLHASLHIAALTAASYLMARLSYTLIEQHFLKLKTRFA